MMKALIKHLLACAGISLGVLLIAPVAAAGEHEADYDAIAGRLVSQCITVQEGEVVLIHGSASNLALLEDIAIAVRKRGAFPLLQIRTDELVRRLYDEVPAKYDTQTPKLGLKLARMIDAAITVSAEEDPSLLGNVPAERIAAHYKTMESVYNEMMSRNVRRVELGNALYPTAALAKQFGISKDKLATIFWSGVNVDYRELQTAADTVKTYLETGKSVRVTGKNGTDLQVRIKGRPVHVNDGVISKEDARAGGAACQLWLPAGEVYLAPVPGTAEGTIVVDRHYLQGQEIRGLRMTFAAGKMISMTAESGLEPLKKLYDAAGGKGKDLFGAIDIGVNPKVRIPSGSRMVAWMASGMVSVGIGWNSWAGGDNATEFALYTHLPNSTLTVDGRTLIDNGTLMP